MQKYYRICSLFLAEKSMTIQFKSIAEVYEGGIYRFLEKYPNKTGKPQYELRIPPSQVVIVIFDTNSHSYKVQMIFKKFA